MNDMQQIRPRNPVAPYLGGKSKLADTIIPYINQIPHTSYCEVFVGMGGVFFRRNYIPKAEFINDYSREVSNFFRILQHHYVAFMEMLKWQITSRDNFEKLIAANPESLTDLQRAARFLYLQRTCFGGKPSGRNFGVSKETHARFDITKLASALEDVHSRLSRVTIEALNYAEFIERYDHKEALFYLDPPYYECENDYGKNMFSRDEFPKMAAQLAKIEGKFIISLNDHPDVREIFKEFHMISVETTYTIAGGDKQSKVGEVLITNAQEHFGKADLFG